MRNFHLPGRSAVHAKRAMAATSHPLATAAALDVLRSGGTAMDAAISASATLCAVEPHMTGIGGDCFVLYAAAGSPDIVAYNGSGRTPRGLQPDQMPDDGTGKLPAQSPHAVTVPGAVDAWWRLHQDHGSRPWADLLAPAIDYAEQGYPVHARVAHDWAQETAKLKACPNAHREMLVDGAAPAEGSLHRQPLLAETLRSIAREGRDGFYRGPVAADIAQHLAGMGGYHTTDDLAEHAGEYVTPISAPYRGYEVCQCPPNGQGLTALIMLRLLAGLTPPDDPLHPQRLHDLAEAARLAYRERDARIADPAFAELPVDEVLGDDYIGRLLGQFSRDRAVPAPDAGVFPDHKDTIYLTVVDEAGNCASFINSLFGPFGSGLMTPRTGVMLHNRGCGFRVAPSDHPNRIEPGKRPLHTIIPGMLKRDDRVVMPFGVMGAHFQPTGHAWLLSNMLDYGLDPQAAVDLPRAFFYDGELQLEAGIPDDTADTLGAMGHRVIRPAKPHGGGQAIWRDPASGVLTAGSDPRWAGCAGGSCAARAGGGAGRAPRPAAVRMRPIRLVWPRRSPRTARYPVLVAL